MRPLPLPLRVAAGIAVTTAEHARELPGKLAGLPVTVVSQALQASMRLQQQVTELAIKGDEALAAFRPVEETPSWATFDEDLDPAEPAAGDRADHNADHNADYRAYDGAGYGNVTPINGEVFERNGVEPEPEPEAKPAPESEARPRTAPVSSESPATPSVSAAPSESPAGIDGYDELTLPQLRARLRRLDLGQLEELLGYERSHANRGSFIGMLSRRISNVRAEGPASGKAGENSR